MDDQSHVALVGEPINGDWMHADVSIDVGDVFA